MTHPLHVVERERHTQNRSRHSVMASRGDNIGSINSMFIDGILILYKLGRFHGLSVEDRHPHRLKFL